MFNTVQEAYDATKADATVIYVPAPFCKDSIIEAVDAGIKLIVCITEGIPVLDMLQVKAYIDIHKHSRLIGLIAQELLRQENAKSVSCQDIFIYQAKLVLYRVQAP